MLLVLQIVLSSIMLVPDQGRAALGVEVLLFAGVLWLVTTTLSLRIIRTTSTAERRHGRQALVLLQAATLPYLAGGVLLLLHRPGALHLIALGMILSFLKAATDAWVLLVEINR